MQNYDQWLEKPYDDQAKLDDYYDEYWETWGEQISSAIQGQVFGGIPANLRAFHRDVNALIETLEPDDRMQWAHTVDPAIPLLEDWAGHD